MSVYCVVWCCLNDLKTRVFDYLKSRIHAAAGALYFPCASGQIIACC